MNVTIYTLPDCSSCKAAKEYLKINNVLYSEKDVSKSKVLAEEMVKISGQMKVPVMDFEGKIVIGFDQDKIDEILGV